MLNVNGVEINFKITSPMDIRRYRAASTKMVEVAEGMAPPPIPPEDPTLYDDYLDNYLEYLEAELQLFGDFVDDAFGEGVANRLLGSNPSLDEIDEIYDALGKAIGEQGLAYGVKLEEKYKPNRATRRASR